jgi:hypothetical protein
VISPINCSLRFVGFTDLVALTAWLKYCVASSRLTIIVAEQATEAVPPHHVPPLTTTCPFRRNESVIEPLVIALCMIVGQVLMDHIIQSTFTQYDHLIEGLLLDGAHEPFAVGIQIRTAGWQEERFHSTALEQAIKHLVAVWK